jgi:hypothetical protein
MNLTSSHKKKFSHIKTESINQTIQINKSDDYNEQIFHKSIAVWEFVNLVKFYHSKQMLALLVITLCCCIRDSYLHLKKKQKSDRKIIKVI